MADKPKKLTPRKFVESIYPNAYGWRPFSTSDYCIYSGTGQCLGLASTASGAWAQAARNLKEKLNG